MTATRVFSVHDVIDAAPISRFQVQSIAVCFAFAMLDGFDAGLIGFVLPALAHDWGVTPASLTPVAVAGLIGTIIGAMTIAPMADRFGRRPVILSCVALFAAFTLASAFATGPATYGALRFLAGIGLGAIPAMMIAYASEYSPVRVRATLVTLMGSGLAAGQFICGFLAAFLIPRHGWESVVLVGGLLPLLALVVVLVLRWLPETPQFLVVRGADRAAAARLAQIDPAFELPAGEEFVRADASGPKVAVAELLRGGRALMTTLVWVLYFAGFLAIYILFSWLPSVLSAGGLSPTAALVGASICTLGGMLGGIGLGIGIDRVRRKFALIAGSYTVGALAIAAAAVTTGVNTTLLFLALFFTGLCTTGTGIAVNAVTASLYPSRMRSTGVGWAYGFGRIGSVVGPTLVGILLGLELSAESIFLATTVPVAVCVVTVLVLSGVAGRRVEVSAEQPVLG